MLRRLLLAALVLTLCGVARAQDKDQLLSQYRNSWQGYPLPAQMFARFVEVEASPDWWTYLMSNPAHKSVQFVELGGSLATLANNMGWGDAASSPELLDGWKGKLSMRIVLPAGLSDELKGKALDNLAILNSPMCNGEVCHPRGGKFLVQVSFSPQAKQFAGKVSQDGGSYDLVLPIHSDVYTSGLEAVFQSGR